MYFEVNTELLSSLFPRFGEEVLRRYRPSEEAEILESKKGDPTCSIGGKLLHSRHDPKREAARIVEGNYSPEADCIVLLGFGLGYYAEACIESYSEAHIVIVEPDVPLFLKALQARDYTPLWRSARVTLLLDPPPEGVSAVLNTLKARSCQVIALRGVYDAYAGYYSGIRDAVKAHLSRSQINRNTLKRFGRLWVRNLGRNLANIAAAEDVSAFADLFSGFPALLLAGGPSLTESIPYLGELKRRFVLVAVDTTLRACEAAGVRPDVLIIVDPQYWNTRHLDGTSLEDLPVVSESSTHPRIFRLFREANPDAGPAAADLSGERGPGSKGARGGSLYLCRSLFPLGRFLDDYTGITGKLGAGGSVATTAWDFCRYSGARPLVCSGLDLGFPDKLTHFRGSFFEERSHELSSRTHPSETHSFAYLLGGDPFPAEDYAGNEVVCDRRMALYRGWFEDQLKQHPDADTQVVGSRGAKIDGVRPLEIEDLLAYPDIRTRIDEVLGSLSPPGYRSGPAEESAEKREGTPGEIAGRSASVIKGIESLLNELEALSDTAGRALEAIDVLETQIKNGSSPSESLEELDRLDQEILASSSKDIAGFIMQRTAESIQAVPEGDEGERSRAALDNSRRLYTGIVESVDFNTRILGRALKALQMPDPV